MELVKQTILIALLQLPLFSVAQEKYSPVYQVNDSLFSALNIPQVKEKITLQEGTSFLVNARDILAKNGFINAQGNAKKRDTILLLHIQEGKKTAVKNQFSFTDSTVFLNEYDDLTLLENESLEKTNELTQEFANQQQELGFPFAQSKRQGVALRGDTLYQRINFDRGPLITLDTLVVKGYAKFSKNVIRYLLNFEPGMPYSERYVQRLPSLIDQVEYLNFAASPAVAFSKDKSTLFLYVNEVKSNQVDGIVGLNTTPEGETTINGDFQLRLLNVFKRGEEIKLRWRRPDESVQSLNAFVEVPFIFKTPLWFQTDLQIFRQDSSFTNTTVNGTLKYFLGGGSLLTGGIGYKASNTLSQTTAGFGNFNTVQYKLGAEFLKTDRVLVPRSGYTIKALGFTANRTSAEATLPQYGWEILLEKYSRFRKRHVLLTAINSQSLFGDNLFTNELYRIGGLKTLRGFNEQQLFTSSYAIGTLEYRYMIGEYDYITAFADVAFAENTASNTYNSDVYTGVGSGLSFRTNVGIFSLFVAVGRNTQTNFDFRTTKVHFGYVSQF